MGPLQKGGVASLVKLRVSSIQRGVTRKRFLSQNQRHKNAVLLRAGMGKRGRERRQRGRKKENKGVRAVFCACIIQAIPHSLVLWF